MSYLEFFGLSEHPFINSPDFRFYFKSRQHEEAIVRVQHAVETMAGLAVLVGEIGTGKTTVARRLLDTLPEDQYEASLLIVTHVDVTSDWFLRKIARQIGSKEIPQEKGELVGRIYERLAEIRNSGRKTIILLDEANMLQSKQVMTEVRGLLNMEENGTKLITFVLIGLPELDEWLETDSPLKQRIALRFRLSALPASSCADYVRHRLTVAGSTREIFSQEALSAVYMHSKGIPRLINTICDNALLEGFLGKKETIGAPEIEGVIIGLGL
jgi:type II secretory pathway predicted ATPase ExeA